MAFDPQETTENHHTVSICSSYKKQWCPHIGKEVCLLCLFDLEALDFLLDPLVFH